MLKCNITFDLDLWPTDLNINRDQLLTTDHLPSKFEASWAKHSWVNRCTRLKETNIPTDKRVQSNMPLLFEGGIKIDTMYWKILFLFPDFWLRNLQGWPSWCWLVLFQPMYLPGAAELVVTGVISAYVVHNLPGAAELVVTGVISACVVMVTGSHSLELSTTLLGVSVLVPLHVASATVLLWLWLESETT